MTRTLHIEEQLERFIAAVDERMLATVFAQPSTTPAAPLILAGGKRLRARLLWLSAAVAADSIPAHDQLLLDTASAIELAHLGSLVHDDIVDRAPTRRGIPTLHRDIGEYRAFIAGAAMIHSATALPKALPSPLRSAFVDAVFLTCRGQLLELLRLFDPYPVRDRFRIMQLKTAALFELAAHAGAVLGGASPVDARSFRRFARRLGIAFQIADDIRDIVGDPRDLGRPNGADLQDGVMTLPMLIASDVFPELRASLHAVHDREHTHYISDWLSYIHRSHSLQISTAIVRRLLARAEDALRSFRSSPAHHALVHVGRSATAVPDTVDASLEPGSIHSLPDRILGQSLAFDTFDAFGISHHIGSVSVFADFDRQICILLQRIHRPLASSAQTLAVEADTLTDQLLLALRTSPRPGNDTLTLGLRAFALASLAASPPRLAGVTAPAIVLSDCIHIVACASLGGSDHPALWDARCAIADHLDHAFSIHDAALVYPFHLPSPLTASLPAA